MSDTNTPPLQNSVTNNSDGAFYQPLDIVDTVEKVVAVFHPKMKGIVHQYCDEAYAAIMESMQDYLRDNVGSNLSAEFRVLQQSNARMQKELYEQGVVNQSLQAENAALRESLQTLFDASTTFASAIRQTTNTAYPWPAMETAEAVARTLLETSHVVK